MTSPRRKPEFVKGGTPWTHHSGDASAWMVAASGKPKAAKNTIANSARNERPLIHSRIGPIMRHYDAARSGQVSNCDRRPIGRQSRGAGCGELFQCEGSLSSVKARRAALRCSV